MKSVLGNPQLKTLERLPDDTLNSYRLLKVEKQAIST